MKIINRVALESPQSKDEPTDTVKIDGHRLGSLTDPTQLPEEVPAQQDGNMLVTGKQRFELGKVLGFGFFGDVRLMREPQTGTVYAAKITNVDHTKGKQWLQQEIGMAAKSGSPLTPKLVMMTNAQQAVMVLPLMSETLTQTATTFRGLNAEDRNAGLLHIARQLITQLHTMHERGLTHADIKPDNIMQRHGDFFLGDFGMTEHVTEENDDRPSDVEQLGLALLKTYLGGKRMNAPGSEELLDAIQPPMDEVLLGMLHEDPQERLTAQQALTMLGEAQPSNPNIKKALSHNESAWAAQVGAWLGTMQKDSLVPAARPD